MASAKDDAPQAPPVIERFMRQLIVASKAVALYPPASKIPHETSEAATQLLGNALREFPEIRIVVDKNGVYFGDAALSPGQPAFTSFAQDAYHHHLASMSFHSGATTRDVVTFLEVLKKAPEEVHATGGFEASLWNRGVSTITVVETQVLLVEAEVFSAAVDEGGEAEPKQIDPDEIDAMLARALAAHARERRAIAHVIGEPATVRRYLETVYRAVVELGDDDLEAVARRFSELAQIARETEDAEHDLTRKLSEALAGLDPELRRRLLAEKVLPEARTSEAMAEVVRQLDPDEILRILAEHAGDQSFSEETFLDGARDLAVITGMPRGDLAARAEAVMRGEGLSESVVETIVDLIAPSRLVIRGEESESSAGQAGAASGADEPRPADVIARIMGLDLTREPTRPDDPDIHALLEEARLGITDGDVISTLVLLATLDVREGNFASTMALLEDSLSVLIGRGDIELAAETAELMRAAARRPELSSEQRQRLEQAVERFARPEDVRSLARALRLYAPDSDEYRAARGLLGMLGPLALRTLLEQLADEPDMSGRKALVELLSGIVGEYVAQLAPSVNDPRWYFVRNVVSILGSTRSPQALPLLERTLRHADARVRRETVRAIASVGGRVSTELLIPALSDSDAAIVQLAARYLGAAGASGAASTANATRALEAVARGEGQGNRENAPRIEAIEALGRIGTAESVPALEYVAGRRALFGAARTRELRAAAEAAIATISARERGAKL